MTQLVLQPCLAWAFLQFLSLGLWVVVEERREWEGGGGGGEGKNKTMTSYNVGLTS